MGAFDFQQGGTRADREGAFLHFGADGGVVDVDGGSEVFVIQSAL